MGHLNAGNKRAGAAHKENYYPQTNGLYPGKK
jgi:hypothetical protein